LVCYPAHGVRGEGADVDHCAGNVGRNGHELLDLLFHGQSRTKPLIGVLPFVSVVVHGDPGDELPAVRDVVVALMMLDHIEGARMVEVGRQDITELGTCFA
jgi:hypothetical protein